MSRSTLEKLAVSKNASLQPQEKRRRLQIVMSCQERTRQCGKMRVFLPRRGVQIPENEVEMGTFQTTPRERFTYCKTAIAGWNNGKYCRFLMRTVAREDEKIMKGAGKRRKISLTFGTRNKSWSSANRVHLSRDHFSLYRKSRFALEDESSRLVCETETGNSLCRSHSALRRFFL